eukprot:358521-Chlamydomonas_euryale.AAC.4
MSGSVRKRAGTGSLGWLQGWEHGFAAVHEGRGVTCFHVGCDHGCDHVGREHPGCERCGCVRHRRRSCKLLKSGLVLTRRAAVMHPITQCMPLLGALWKPSDLLMPVPFNAAAVRSPQPRPHYQVASSSLLPLWATILCTLEADQNGKGVVWSGAE